MVILTGFDVMHLKSSPEVSSNLKTRVVSNPVSLQVVIRPVVKVPTVTRSVRAYGIIDDAKKTASDFVDNVKDSWQSGKDKVSTEASKVAGDVRDQAEKIVGDATDKAEEVSGDAKSAAKSAKSDSESEVRVLQRKGAADKAADTGAAEE
jgi:vacuolar-type H+-ATPase subunit H